MNKRAAEEEVPTPHDHKRPACGCEMPAAGGGAAVVESLPHALPAAGNPCDTLVLGTNTSTFEAKAREFFARTDHAFWSAPPHRPAPRTIPQHIIQP